MVEDSSGNKHMLQTEETSFEAVLDIACERLWEKQIQYSVQRIRELDAELIKLENDLDEILRQSI